MFHPFGIASSARLLAATMILAVLVSGCHRSSTLTGPAGSPADPSAYPGSQFLVSADWLHAQLGDATLRIVDLSAISDYQQGHIPGAVHLWWQDTIELHNDVYGMMVGNSAIEQLVREAGITPDSHVVLYDASGDRYAARFLWMLNANGFDNASLLNGGRQAWIGRRFSFTKSVPSIQPGQLDLKINYDVLIGADTVAAHLADPSYVFVDNRTASEQRETWYGKLRRGMIPGAALVPWDELTFGNRVPYYRSPDDLRALFEKAGITPDKKVVVYGLDGVSADQTYVALKLLGYPTVLVYDGSWAQWGADSSRPIVSLPTAGVASPSPRATP